MKGLNGSHRASTTYMVAELPMRREEVFRDYLLPGGTTARVLNKDIYSEAVRRAGQVLEEINARHSRHASVSQARPSGSKGDE